MPERLATQLLRLARDPATGRLHNPAALASGLRAALFAELILTGRITESGTAPVAIGPSESGDRVLDAVHRAVAARPGVAWWRWFRYVHADRVALADELVATGVWTPRAGVRAGYDDTAAGDVLERGLVVQQLSAGALAPVGARPAVLAVLDAMCGASGGRPQPRAVRRVVRAVASPRRFAKSGPPAAPLRAPGLPAVVAVLAASPEPGAELLPRMLVGACRLVARPLRRGR